MRKRCFAGVLAAMMALSQLSAVWGGSLTGDELLLEDAEWSVETEEAQTAVIADEAAEDDSMWIAPVDEAKTNDELFIGEEQGLVQLPENGADLLISDEQMPEDAASGDGKIEEEQDVLPEGETIASLPAEEQEAVFDRADAVDTGEWRAWGLDDEGTETDYAVIYASPKEAVDLTVYTEGADSSTLTYSWSDSQTGEMKEEPSNTFHIPAVTENMLYNCTVADQNGASAVIFFSVNVENHFTAYTLDNWGWETSEYYGSVTPGGSVTLQVYTEADDMSGISYRWYKEGEDEEIAGETGDTLSLSELDEWGAWYCVVEDGYGGSIAIWFHISIDNALRVSASPYENTGAETIAVGLGEAAVLQVFASAYDMDGLTYSWQCTDDPEVPFSVSDTDPSICTVPSVENRTNIECRVEDRFGNSSYASFTILVENGFKAWLEGAEGRTSVSMGVEPGKEAELKIAVSAKDTSGLTYSWMECTDPVRFVWKDLDVIGNVLVTPPINERHLYWGTVKDQFGNYEIIQVSVYAENHLVAYVKGKNPGVHMTSYTVPYDSSKEISVAAIADRTDKLTYSWTITHPDGETETGVSNTDTLTIDHITDYVSADCNVDDGYGNSSVVLFSLAPGTALDVWIHGEETGTRQKNLVYPGKGTLDLTVDTNAADPGSLSIEWEYDESAGTFSEDGLTLHVEALSRASYVGCNITDGKSWENLHFYLSTDNELKAFVAGSPTQETSVTYQVEPGTRQTLSVEVTAKDAEDLDYEWMEFYGQGYGDLVEAGSSYTTPPMTMSTLYGVDVLDRYGNRADMVSFNVEIANHLEAAADEDGQTDTVVWVNPADGKANLRAYVTADDMTGMTYEWYAEYYNPSDYNSVAFAKNVPEVALSGLQEEGIYICVVEDRFGSKRELYYRVKFKEPCEWDEGVVTKKPTCTQEGEKTFTCTLHGETRTEAIPAAGHKQVKIAAVAPTCTKTGLTEGEKCSICGEILKEQTVVKATGHKWSAWKTTKAATALAAGTQQRTCSVCKKTETKSIAKLKATLTVSKTKLRVAKTKSAKVNVNFTKGDVITAKSSNTKIATVTYKNGIVTIKALEKAGTAKVTVKTKTGLSRTITVTVPKAKTKKLTCMRTVIVKKGNTITLEPTVTPSYSDEKVTYTSTKKSIAKVTAKGVVKGIKKGKTYITVKSGKKTVKVKVTVK